MASMLSSKKPQGWSREFDVLIRGIGECKSKAEEDAIIAKEVEVLKPRLKDPRLDKRYLKEVLVRLIYVEMLGHDASWAHVKALQACSATHLLTKKVAYLTSSLFLDHTSDTIILVVNTIQGDLKSDNHLVVCAALTATCKLISADLVSAILPTVVGLLSHPKELVRKKAVCALHRFHQLDPTHDEALAGCDLDKYLRQMLCDKDPSVMAAALNALSDMALTDPGPHKNLIPSFVSILKQVTEHRLPKTYDYHRTPAPFIQIKLLKILATLGAGDKAASDNTYAVVADTMRRANTGNTIGNAIVYEAVRTITTIYPSPALLQSAAEMISTFLKASSHNLKYIGIDALARIVRINPKYAAEHQLAVIDCLEDPDETLKKKTLELLSKMTKPNNVEVIVEKMIEYLRGTTDEVAKAYAVKRIAELAERFAPDTQWFVDTMNQVFELGGDVVEEQLADNLMRLIAEGVGDEDPEADAELRGAAVQSYLDLLDKPKLPDILLKVICWVLGEYGTLTPQGEVAVIDKIAAIADTQTVSDSVRGYMLTAIAKVAAQSGAQLTSAAELLLEDAAASRNIDLQQRALEVQALLSGPRQTQAAVLPPDASCEDVEVDKNLHFLDGFVSQALANGAMPYISEAERYEMGVVRPSHHDEAVEHSHQLRFAAYETPVLPTARQATPPPVLSASTSSTSGYDYGAGPSSGGAAAAAATPQQSSEPQLAIKGAARRWGPASYGSPAPAAAAPSASSNPVATHVNYAEPASASPAAYEQPSGPQSEKEKLAATLFGDSAGGSRSRTRRPAPKISPTRQPRRAEEASREASPVAPAANLLDLDAGSAPAPAAAAPPPPPVSADPFTELSSLTVPSDPAPNSAPTTSVGRAPIDLNDLMGTSTPGATNPAGIPPSSAFPAAAVPDGFGAAAAAANGGLGQSAAVVGAAVPLGRGAMKPMAPRGNAAVEKQQGRKDPFADIFS